MTLKNDTKHTPGPWQVCNTYAICGPEPLSSVIAVADRRNGVLTSTAKRNARLIAAAPEMLEALGDIADAAYGTDTPKLRDRARAAIAKAEGR
jgi:hypothetical protein